MEKNEEITGFTCNKCGKVFQTEEEFLNRHNKKIEKNTNYDGPSSISGGN
jgi:uncharacterized OB-fold protein